VGKEKCFLKNILGATGKWMYVWGSWRESVEASSLLEEILRRVD